MSAPAPERLSGGSGLAPAYAAVRVRVGLVAVLFALAGLGWWWTARQMRGMDEGPWTGLGSLAWFLGIWVTMMAAMMFPSVAPTVALYSRMTRQRYPLAAATFVAGYLVTWTAAGLVAFTLAAVVGSLWGDVLAWDGAGRWVAGTVLLVAAAYELTPLKDVCLGRCRSPLGFLIGSWRDGRWGALRMGATNGAWCVGCCWALMASLFALGVMSVTWMAVVAALIALEKTLPWRRLATYGTAALLLALGVLLLAAPRAIPALSVPGSEPMNEVEPMDGMEPMGSAGLPGQL
jgi:predicted metal-binding membrane protein